MSYSYKEMLLAKKMNKPATSTHITQGKSQKLDVDQGKHATVSIKFTSMNKQTIYYYSGIHVYMIKRKEGEVGHGCLCIFIHRTRISTQEGNWN